MKKKGSAIIMVILLLGFFTAMSLNIYYIGQKKAEGAGDKKTGEELTNYIDIASSIIYQEAYLAENFVRKGVVYDSSGYTAPTTDNSYSYFNYSTNTYTSEYAGIQLSSISEYFDSNWNYKLDDAGGETGASSQKLIMNEVVEDGEVESRIWQSGGVPSKITKLWEDTDLLSIGGYKLTGFNVDDSDDATNDDFDKDEIQDAINYMLGNSLQSIDAVFEKTVTINGNDDIPSMTFVITATETVNLDTASGTTLANVDFYGAVMSLSIEKQ